MADYDPDNIFARILRGELPCHKVYEDSETLAFMDIMPRADGHALVIPKTPCVNTLDAPPAVLGATIETVRKIARAAMTAFAAEGIKIEQYNEASAGQVVFHLHFHVLPRWRGVELRPPGCMGDQAAIAAHAGKLGQALQADRDPITRPVSTE